MVCMVYFVIVGFYKVNGVVELYLDFIKIIIFKDFVIIFGFDKFINVINGIMFCRWFYQVNFCLFELILSKIGGKDFLMDFNEFNKIELYVKDKVFCKVWVDIKFVNKECFVKYIKVSVGVIVDLIVLFDV